MHDGKLQKLTGVLDYYPLSCKYTYSNFLRISNAMLKRYRYSSCKLYMHQYSYQKKKEMVI